MIAIERVIQTATNEVGYLEKKTNSQLDDKTANAGYNNWTKYARDLDNIGFYNGKKNGYAWCDMFVDWCFVQTFGLEAALQLTGQEKNGSGASTTASANYYKQIGRFYKTNPQPGDQIFFSNDGGKSMNHTGLVIKVTKDKVYTIEGNTSSTNGVVPNGGAVRTKSYSLTYNKIGGYGRPKYELILEEEEEEMTKEQFREMLKECLNDMAKEESTWEEGAMIWAQKEGLMQGDENGNIMPKKFMTRGEFATVLQRYDSKH